MKHKAEIKKVVKRFSLVTAIAVAYFVPVALVGFLFGGVPAGAFLGIYLILSVITLFSFA